MIARLVGIVVALEDSRKAIVDVQGVGYEVLCSQETLSKITIGEEATLIVYTDMRESAIALYGFSSALEKKLFAFLNEVKGVGPKHALEILSCFEASELLRVIGSGNAALVQQAKGIGKKTAERIILELQDKVSQYALNTQGLRASMEIETVPSLKMGNTDTIQDSVLALRSLGFTLGASEKAVESARRESPNLEDAGEIVKRALAFL